MKFFSLALMAVAGLALVGCSQSKLSGKWNMGATKTPTGQTIEFTDKGFTMNSVAGQGERSFTLKILGSYVLEAEKLTLKAESATIDDSKLSPTYQTQLRKFVTPAKVVESLNQNSTFGIKFTDNDTATLTSSTAGSSQLTRIKS